MSVGVDPDPTVRPVRVCHINLYSYPALWRDPAQPSQPTGGAELQQAMIARAAAGAGWIPRSSRWMSVKAAKSW